MTRAPSGARSRLSPNPPLAIMSYRAWLPGRTSGISAPTGLSFDFGGVRFIDLNSSATMSPGSSQYAFAQASLGSSAPACVVGIWHIPPILESANQAKILPMWALFANAGGDLVLNGHAHANVEYKPMDASLMTGQPGSHMVDLIAGSSGDILGSGGTDPRVAWKPQVKTVAVLYLTLNGAASGGIATSISWVYKDLAGTVLRSGSINCGGGGDTAAPNTTVTAPAANAVLGSSSVTMTGTASDNVDVDRVNVTLQNTTTGAWLQPNGTFGTSAAVVTATLVNDTVTATGWQVSATLPNGSYALTATAVDTSAIADPSPATRSFTVSVSTGPDTVAPNGILTVPSDGQIFTTRVITMSGTATDDRDMGKVGVAIWSFGTQQWLHANGTFGAWVIIPATITVDNGATVTWAYTTPTLPPGSYRVNLGGVYDAAGNKDTSIATATFVIQ